MHNYIVPSISESEKVEEKKVVVVEEEEDV